MKVKVNSFYLSNYCGMKNFADKIADVISVTSRPIKAADLSASDLVRFIERYGKLDIFPLDQMMIKYQEDNRLLIVSPFGYDEVL